MRAFLVVLAVVWTLLLASIAIDLRSLNQSLSWLRISPSTASALARTAAGEPIAETREQRRARYGRELKAATERLEDYLNAPIPKDDQSAKPTSQPARK